MNRRRRYRTTAGAGRQEPARHGAIAVRKLPLPSRAAVLWHASLSQAETPGSLGPQVTKLLSPNADTDDMSEIGYEPRTVMWARAEVCWLDDAGSRCVAVATIEDTSASGACIRMRTPVRIGSQVNVKWHRGEFSGVARNCRRDGIDFLLGVRREQAATPPARPETKPTEAPA